MLAEVGWKVGVGGNEGVPSPAGMSRSSALGRPGTPLKMRKVAPQQDEQALASRDHATIKTRAGIY